MTNPGGALGPPPTAPGGVVAPTPSIDANTIDATLKAEHPAEYQATHMGEQASRIYQLLGQHMAGGVTAS